jgi:hypothetical protein
MAPSLKALARTLAPQVPIPTSTPATVSTLYPLRQVQWAEHSSRCGPPSEHACQQLNHSTSRPKFTSTARPASHQHSALPTAMQYRDHAVVAAHASLHSFCPQPDGQSFTATAPRWARPPRAQPRRRAISAPHLALSDSPEAGADPSAHTLHVTPVLARPSGWHPPSSAALFQLGDSAQTSRDHPGSPPHDKKITCADVYLYERLCQLTEAASTIDLDTRQPPRRPPDQAGSQHSHGTLRMYPRGSSAVPETFMQAHHTQQSVHGMRATAVACVALGGCAGALPSTRPLESRVCEKGEVYAGHDGSHTAANRSAHEDIVRHGYSSAGFGYYAHSCGQRETGSMECTRAASAGTGCSVPFIGRAVAETDNMQDPFGGRQDNGPTKSCAAGFVLSEARGVQDTFAVCSDAARLATAAGDQASVNTGHSSSIQPRTSLQAVLRPSISGQLQAVSGAYGSVRNAPAHGQDPLGAQSHSGQRVPRSSTVETAAGMNVSCRSVSPEMAFGARQASEAGSRGAQLADCTITNPAASQITTNAAIGPADGSSGVDLQGCGCSAGASHGTGVEKHVGNPYTTRTWKMAQEAAVSPLHSPIALLEAGPAPVGCVPKPELVTAASSVAARWKLLESLAQQHLPAWCTLPDHSLGTTPIVREDKACKFVTQRASEAVPQRVSAAPTRQAPPCTAKTSSPLVYGPSTKHDMECAAVGAPVGVLTISKQAGGPTSAHRADRDSEGGPRHELHVPANVRSRRCSPGTHHASTRPKPCATISAAGHAQQPSQQRTCNLAPIPNLLTPCRPNPPPPHALAIQLRRLCSTSTPSAEPVSEVRAVVRSIQTSSSTGRNQKGEPKRKAAEPRGSIEVDLHSPSSQPNVEMPGNIRRPGRTFKHVTPEGGRASPESASCVLKRPMCADLQNGNAMAKVPRIAPVSSGRTASYQGHAPTPQCSAKAATCMGLFPASRRTCREPGSEECTMFGSKKHCGKDGGYYLEVSGLCHQAGLTRADIMGTMNQLESDCIDTGEGRCGGHVSSLPSARSFARLAMLHAIREGSLSAGVHQQSTVVASFAALDGKDLVCCRLCKMKAVPPAALSRHSFRGICNVCKSMVNMAHLRKIRYSDLVAAARVAGELEEPWMLVCACISMANKCPGYQLPPNHTTRPLQPRGMPPANMQSVYAAPSVAGPADAAPSVASHDGEAPAAVGHAHAVPLAADHARMQYAHAGLDVHDRTDAAPAVDGHDDAATVAASTDPATAAGKRASATSPKCGVHPENTAGGKFICAGCGSTGVDTSSNASVAPCLRCEALIESGRNLGISVAGMRRLLNYIGGLALQMAMKEGSRGPSVIMCARCCMRILIATCIRIFSEFKVRSAALMGS